MSRGEEAAHQVERPDAFEHTDVAPAGIYLFFLGLGTTILVTLLAIYWLFGWFTHARSSLLPFPSGRPDLEFPQPRLQAEPLIDLHALHAQEDAVLNTYGWVDRKAGAVRIPVDRAMELLSQHGLPARQPGQPVPTVPDTGPESGGPQTGKPQPRVLP